jgi:hypothetical protein
VTTADEIVRLGDCNCSICSKKGILHHRTPVDRFKLLSGESMLALYQFNTETAKHWFCPDCGIHAFGSPRNNPERYTVNARCFDDYDAISQRAERVPFDGQNYSKDKPQI